MKKILTIALTAIVLLSAGVSCKKYDTVKGDPMKTQIYTLENGLKVYMTVNKEEPRIQTFIAVRVGGKNDPSETTGLAHYFEHLMFKGTQQFGTSDYEAEKPLLDEIEQLFEVYRKTEDENRRAEIYHRIDSISYEASKISIPNEYDKLMTAIGANGTNAWTSQDETVYTEDIPSNQIDNWAKIQADRFKNIVIRGFHTELETIYEEKNMSLTQDSRKVWEALDNALFPNHPYGKQTVLGTQEHLKNPSITNVKNYHDQYYVPNNVAICASGDFDPDEFVKTIEKYFGDWQPNPEIPVLEYEKEAPITEPIVREVFGLESENILIGWPLPGARDLKSSAIATVAGEILSNGQAGLIDLDINQQQKALGMYGGYAEQPDYSMFEVGARPKEGQTLEEIRDLALAEVAKLRNGEFDESILKAVNNNLKLNIMRRLESNRSRANMFVDAFIARLDWADYVKSIERFEAVTKEDITNWANQYLGENGYAIIYKRQGEDKSVQKISAPKITPIETNRDKQSAFLTEIQNTEVAPIEPVFVDFSKDMSQFKLDNGVNVLYKKNELNDIAQLSFIWNDGTETDPALSTAFSYLEYLGTAEKSAEDIAKEMYALGCSFGMGSGANSTSVSISGLSENIEKALTTVENLIANAVADDEILTNLKGDILKSRINGKKNQSGCFSRLQQYMYFGGEFIDKTTLDNNALAAITSEDLLAKVRNIVAQGHEITYFGPQDENTVKTLLENSHKVVESEPAPEKHPVSIVTDKNSVVMVQYDAKQLYYFQYSGDSKTFIKDADPSISLYNEYFGGGMNAIVFQEMREARGLAYSAWSRLYVPSYADDTYSYCAFIATQNDKMRIAIEAFDDIINNMPESQAAFDIAKNGLITRMRTERTNGASVLGEYRRCRRLGIDEPLAKARYEAIQNMTLEDIKAFQQEWVKGRNYTYGILGDIKDLDVNYLKTLGEVKTISLEDIFGY